MPLNALTHLIHQFELVILLVKALYKLSCFEGKNSMSPGVKGRPKKHGKSFTYYLNGPLPPDLDV
jgi:hypothetical protein